MDRKVPKKKKKAYDLQQLEQNGRLAEPGKETAAAFTIGEIRSRAALPAHHCS
jgi:hypothetical protein